MHYRKKTEKDDRYIMVLFIDQKGIEYIKLQWNIKDITSSLFGITIGIIDFQKCGKLLLLIKPLFDLDPIFEKVVKKFFLTTISKKQLLAKNKLTQRG